MKRTVGNTLLILTTVALMLAAFETVSRNVIDNGLQYDLEMWKYATQLKRISDNPAIGHEHRPGARAHLMGADVAINALGLRNAEIAGQKPAGAKRIVMLGDSITFGWGVANDATMSVLLERELNERGYGQAEVINTGVGNYNTTMEVAYFLERGASLNPDVIVLNYFINDAEPTPSYTAPSWIARHSYAYVVLGGGWDRFKRLILGGPDWRAAYAALYDDAAPGWAAARENIRRLAAYCREHDIRLVLTNIPELHELDPYPFEFVNAKVRDLAMESGIEYLDLLPALRSEAASSLWVTAPDPHPNAKAHALMARALADYLLKPN
jgi:lysophospholipase L1-like esterase